MDRVDLTVMTYDSFMAKGGLGEQIIPLFEKNCSCRLRVLPSGDAAQMLARLAIDSQRGKPQAQVVVGLDQVLWPQAQTWIEPWGSWRPPSWDRIRPELRTVLTANGVRDGEGFLPLDYGVYAFIADLRQIKKLKLSLPHSLWDLLKPEWKRNLLLEDPRTSTPGLSFLLYTAAITEGKRDAFWRALTPQWLTLAQGWDAAYGLFLKGEAPLVWSYTTSQAYHEEHGDLPANRRYVAVSLDEGHPLQVEGAALIKGSFSQVQERSRAEAFLEFLLSEEVQRLVPKGNWMLPVRQGVPVPESFARLPQPKRLVSVVTDPSEVKKVLDQWTRAR